MRKVKRCYHPHSPPKVQEASPWARLVSKHPSLHALGQCGQGCRAARAAAADVSWDSSSYAPGGKAQTTAAWSCSGCCYSRKGNGFRGAVHAPLVSPVPCGPRDLLPSLGGERYFCTWVMLFLICKMFSWMSPHLINYDDLVRWELLCPFKMGKLRLRKGVPILVRPDQV